MDDIGGVTPHIVRENILRDSHTTESASKRDKAERSSSSRPSAPASHKEAAAQSALKAAGYTRIDPRTNPRYAQILKNYREGRTTSGDIHYALPNQTREIGKAAESAVDTSLHRPLTKAEIQSLVRQAIPDSNGARAQVSPERIDAFLQQRGDVKDGPRALFPRAQTPPEPANVALPELNGKAAGPISTENLNSALKAAAPESGVNPQNFDLSSFSRDLHEAAEPSHEANAHNNFETGLYQQGHPENF